MNQECQLERFETNYSREGLFVRYARGRIATFWVRQVFSLIGVLALSLLLNWGVALLAMAVFVGGEALECLMLDRLIKRHPDGNLPGKMRGGPLLAAMTQALTGVGAVWLLYWNLEEPSGLAILIVIIAGGALNAGVTLSHVPVLAAWRLTIYVIATLSLLATELSAGVDPNLFASEVTAVVVAALLIWLATDNVRSGFGRSVSSRRDLLRKSIEAADAQRRLAEREAETHRLAQVARHASDSIFITGPNSRIEYVNDAFTRMSGYAPEEALGRDPRELLPTAASESMTVESIEAAISARQPIRTEILLQVKAGRQIWNEIIISPLVDERGQPDGHVCVARDISEKKAREAQLMRASFVAKHANDGILIADESGGIVYANDALSRLTGFSHSELIGRKTIGLFLDPPNAPRLRQTISASIREGTSVRAELMLVRREDAPLWIESSIAPLTDDEGNLSGHINVTRDISEAKRREIELAEAKAVTEEALQAKTRFLATMSHEIRTPLNGIIGTADLLAAGDLDPVQRDYVGTLVQSSEALLTIVNDILETSRLEAGRVDFVEERFDVRETIDAVVRLMRPAAEHKGLRIEGRVASELSSAFSGDAGRLRQILLNLTGNAIKFTESGSVQLSADKAPDGILEIAVQDSGIGIPSDRLDAVFESFTQADGLTSRRFGGTGLGLTISRTLARAMGGDIVVTSEDGKGSTFTVRLPLMAAEESERREEAAPRDVKSGETLAGRRVLVAEDNKTNRFLIAQFLADAGIDVRFAENGQAAVDAFRADRPDVILMDVSMPVKDGLTATREIRALERGEPPCPIIGLTANVFEEDRKNCFDAGMTGFLPKPIKRAELTAALGNALSVSMSETCAAE